MSKLIIRGGRRLSGTVRVHGAKNAVLPAIAAAILGASGETTVHDAPLLDDVETFAEVLRALGIQVQRERDSLRINAQTVEQFAAPSELVQKMRASILVMGPLLSRFGRARVPLPGGCAIGARPIDQHLKGFEAMGALVRIGENEVEATLPEGRERLQGARIYLDVASVGATENIMMAATLAEGTTVIENAAREPEIVDLSNMLNAMGASVRGAGTETIRIDGVTSLHAVEHTVIPDRIEAGTYLIAAAITGGDVTVTGGISDHLASLLAKLREMGITIHESDHAIRIDASKPLHPVDLKTLPYPGFPTDLQAQMMALLAVVPGNSMITETIFENRFMHVPELQRFQANILVDGRQAIVTGVSKLCATHVQATDLRAGAALVLAALAADGQSEIGGLHHLDRGYVDLVQKFHTLGADITRDELPAMEPTSDISQRPAYHLF